MSSLCISQQSKLKTVNLCVPIHSLLGNFASVICEFTYDVEEEPEAVVYINAVGIKERNEVRIAGEVYDL